MAAGGPVVEKLVEECGVSISGRSSVPRLEYLSSRVVIGIAQLFLCAAKGNKTGAGQRIFAEYDVGIGKSRKFKNIVMPRYQWINPCKTQGFKVFPNNLCCNGKAK